MWFGRDVLFKEHAMKAVRIHEFGGPEVLKHEDVSDLRKDYVLIRIRACALNHLDLWVRKGLPGVKLPHILGSDIAGEVAECGEYITDLKPGTRVLLSPMLFCGHCEQCNSGRQNFCPQFAVLGNNAEGGNCELIAVPRDRGRVLFRPRLPRGRTYRSSDGERTCIAGNPGGQVVQRERLGIGQPAAIPLHPL